MRAVRIHDHGGPEVLSVEDIPRPEPGPNEVLVEVAAAGVNPVDTYFRVGSYTPVELPFTPGVDVAGTVVATGSAVETISVDTPVLGTGIGNATHQGAYAEYAVVPTDRLVPLAGDVDLQMAGAAGVVGCTAWRALVDHAALAPAESCLVHGGAGGVGHVAVQIAAAMGATVITTAAPTYHDTLADLGADVVLDYERDDLASAVREAADGGVDVVLDHRLDEYLQFDADVAATSGRVVGIGENRPDPGFSDDGVARSKDVSYHFMSMFNTPDLRDPLGGVAQFMATDRLSVHIADSYPLDAAATAQQAVLKESYLGKLAISP
ncbi:MAG: NADPH:quinone reductase [Salinarchaeum sp.]